ncbi:hypothetical protein GCM10010392_64090 [Streptomyces clavifer]|nr:hypothetical protein GCM10010392_64090 [Streptomyces clavifer]
MLTFALFDQVAELSRRDQSATDGHTESCLVNDRSEGWWGRAVEDRLTPEPVVDPVLDVRTGELGNDLSKNFTGVVRGLEQAR